MGKKDEKERKERERDRQGYTEREEKLDTWMQPYPSPVFQLGNQHFFFCQKSVGVECGSLVIEIILIYSGAKPSMSEGSCVDQKRR